MSVGATGQENRRYPRVSKEQQGGSSEAWQETGE